MPRLTAEEALGAARKYTKQTAAGMGALKGAPCQIKSIVYDVELGTNTVTFLWEDKNGVQYEDTLVIHDSAKYVQTLDFNSVSAKPTLTEFKNWLTTELLAVNEFSYDFIVNNNKAVYDDVDDTKILFNETSTIRGSFILKNSKRNFKGMIFNTNGVVEVLEFKFENIGAGSGLITDFDITPIEGGSSNVIKIDNQTLVFTNKVASVSDNRITSNSGVCVFFKDSSLDEASRCKISAVSKANEVEFTAEVQPTINIVCDIVIFN